MGVHQASEMGIARVPAVAGALVCLCNGKSTIRAPADLFAVVPINRAEN